MGTVAGQRLLFKAVLPGHIHNKVSTPQIINEIKIQLWRRNSGLVRHILAQLGIKNRFFHQLAAGNMIGMPVFPIWGKYDIWSELADFQRHCRQMFLCHI
ncbi:hypothetical protein D3C73_1202450 [compost metagenome]